LKITKKKISIAGTALVLLSLLLVGILKITRERTIPLRDFSEIVASGTLKVVTEYNSVGYYVSGDSIAGMQYDLCRYIERRSGLKVRIALENSLEISIEKLRNNTFDVIAINIPITNESRKELAFTVPITRNKQVLVQRKSDETNAPLIRNQMDLAHRTILVPKHSPAILRLRNLSDEIAEPIVIQEVEDYAQEQLVYMVAYGETDYAVVANEIALKNAQLFPDIDVQTDISFTQYQAWAVRKNSPALLDSLNVWISDYKSRKLK
jgi:membrane-bound lytic murein transglycosylase MltF